MHLRPQKGVRVARHAQVIPTQIVCATRSRQTTVLPSFDPRLRGGILGFRVYGLGGILGNRVYGFGGILGFRVYRAIGSRFRKCPTVGAWLQ